MRSRCIFASFVVILWVASNGPSQAGLVSRWKMDGNADDAIGTRDGTLIDNPSFVNDVPPPFSTGQSISLDGQTQKMNYDVTGSDSLSGTYTVALWAKPSEERVSSGALAMFGTRSPSDFSFDMKFQIGTQVRIDVGNGSSFSIADASFDYTVDEWYHVVVVVDGGNRTVYVDGVSIGATSGVTPPLLWDSQHDIAIGAVWADLNGGNPQGEEFPGLIDDVRVYNNALTASQVEDLYNLPEPHSGALLVCLTGAALLAYRSRRMLA